MINYNNVFEQTLKAIEQLNTKPSLLLHVCCGVCSSSVFERLINYFDVTIYFYNPNIHPKEEYLRRRDELIEFVGKFNIDYNASLKFIEGLYDVDTFYKLTERFKDCKEGGARCRVCFSHRMNEGFNYAEQNGYDYFTTVLTVSRHKNSKVINQIATGLQNHHTQTKYLFSDFKKKNGTKRSDELATQYDMYRQEYCGCEFSTNRKNDN